MQISDFPIIDMHVHLFPDSIALRAAQSISDYYGIPLKGDGSYSKYFELAGGLNLKRIIISSAATRAKNVPTANDFIHSLTASNSLIMGMGSTHAEFNENEEELARILKMGLCGLKYHCDFQGFAIDDERMDTAYSLAQKYKLPVLFHAGDEKSDFTSPKRIHNVMKRFPELIIIAAHMGGYLHKEDSEKYLVGENIYFDISEWDNIMSAGDMCDMVKRHGREKILFGSDYPLISPYEAVEKLISSGLDEESLHMIFHENAEKLYKIS